MSASRYCIYILGNLYHYTQDQSIKELLLQVQDYKFYVISKTTDFVFREDYSRYLFEGDFMQVFFWKEAKK